jgi:uncharacterized Zn-finger protein
MTREALASAKPKYGYTVGDHDRVTCPWCANQLILEPNDVRDGPMKCPHCDKPLRIRVDRRVTIRLYPVTASVEDSWAG